MAEAPPLLRGFRVDEPRTLFGPMMHMVISMWRGGRREEITSKREHQSCVGARVQSRGRCGTCSCALGKGYRQFWTSVEEWGRDAMRCDVVWRDAMWCDVMWGCVSRKSRTAAVAVLDLRDILNSPYRKQVQISTHEMPTNRSKDTVEH